MRIPDKIVAVYMIFISYCNFSTQFYLLSSKLYSIISYDDIISLDLFVLKELTKFISKEFISDPLLNILLINIFNFFFKNSF